MLIQWSLVIQLDCQPGYQGTKIALKQLFTFSRLIGSLNTTVVCGQEPRLVCSSCLHRSSLAHHTTRLNSTCAWKIKLDSMFPNVHFNEICTEIIYLYYEMIFPFYSSRLFFRFCCRRRAKTSARSALCSRNPWTYLVLKVSFHFLVNFYTAWILTTSDAIVLFGFLMFPGIFAFEVNFNTNFHVI